MTHPDAITLKQLRALAAVAAHGSITRAAEAIRLTPPAVHAQLKQLADHCETPMLHRGEGGGMELTEEGKLVVATMARIEAELDACLRDVAEHRKGRAGLVRIGVVSTGKYFAPALVATLKTVFPDIKVELIIGNREGIIASLETRQVHLAIMGRPPRQPANISKPLGPHPHVLIAPPGHRLAGIADIGADALFDETFIGREDGSGTRILMNRFLDRIGDGRPYDVITMSSNETIKQAVIAGLGVALISQHTVVEELHAGRLVTLCLPGLPIERTWFLLHRADTPLTPAARRIHDHIAAMQGSFLPKV